MASGFRISISAKQASNAGKFAWMSEKRASFILWNFVSGFGYQVSSIRYQVGGWRCQVSDISILFVVLDIQTRGNGAFAVVGEVVIHFIKIG